MYSRSTPQALKLKRELEMRGLIVQDEKWDGHKHIDLAIPRARLDIEIDGNQHYESAHQILSDLDRSHYSNNEGYSTIHIPNEFIDNPGHFERLITALTKAAYVRMRRFGHRLSYHHYK
jgi:very-short-patch-repair endonuclease